MKKLLLSITALAVLGAPALAADLARPIDKAPPPVVFNWSGCYIGVSGGGIWARSQEEWVPNAGLLNPLLTSNGSGSHSGIGGIVGGTFGCNVQGAAVVLGLEGDVGWTGVKGSRDNFVPATLALPAVDIHEDFRLKWLTTFRLRLGVTVGERSLLYATGGFAGANVNTFDQAVFPAAANSNTFSGSGFRAGWTLGGGIEHAFAGQWSAKAEYLYARLNSFSTNTTNSNLAVQLTIEHQRWIDVQMFRVGLNYRFGGAYAGW